MGMNGWVRWFRERMNMVMKSVFLKRTRLKFRFEEGWKFWVFEEG